MTDVDLLSSSLTRPQLDRETLRIYEICDGCRRCHNLCPSFNTLLDRIDAVDSDAAKLLPADRERVVQECYYCKLCYNHCPYIPPHQYGLDFPRLMIASKQVSAREQGVRWRDRLLTNTNLIGRAASAAAPLVNWVMRTDRLRPLIERLTGIHRARRVLPFQSDSLRRWWARRGASSPEGPIRGKVALFASCLVSHQTTGVGKAAVQVLERNGVEVVLPQQECCGMPSFDIGDTDAIRNAARANLQHLRPWLDRGYDVVSPVPSCSLMLKREYPSLLPGDEATVVARRTFDICEYLMRLKKAGHLSDEFVRNPGRIAYQVPCHLRDQNIGFKSKELMELTGARVEVVERCSGHDGTWGAKAEFFKLSMGIAAKAVRELDQVPADLIASDCPLSALQLEQAGAAERTPAKRVFHPIEIVRDAYGLPA
jgi:Fe-S oxidoreductase